jgi:hypothetical protein
MDEKLLEHRFLWARLGSSYRALPLNRAVTKGSGTGIPRAGLEVFVTNRLLIEPQGSPCSSYSSIQTRCHHHAAHASSHVKVEVPPKGRITAPL